MSALRFEPVPGAALPPVLPRALPRAIPGVPPGTIRHSIPRTLRGTIPRALPRTHPRTIPRALQGTQGGAGQGALRGALRGAIPRALPRAMGRTLHRVLGHLNRRPTSASGRVRRQPGKRCSPHVRPVERNRCERVFHLAAARCHSLTSLAHCPARSSDPAVRRRELVTRSISAARRPSMPRVQSGFRPVSSA